MNRRIVVMVVGALVSGILQGKEPTYRETVRSLKMWPEGVYELVDETGRIRVAVALDRQGQVVTSTSNGEAGRGIGWVEPALWQIDAPLESGRFGGGLDRVLLGPEGGPFGLFYDGGAEQTPANWRVPSALARGRFAAVAREDTAIAFLNIGRIRNRAGTEFGYRLERTVALLDAIELRAAMGVLLPDGLNMLGVLTSQSLKNTGENLWAAETGQLGLRIRGALRGSPEAIVVVPHAGRGPDAEAQALAQSEPGMVLTDEATFIRPGDVTVDRIRFLPGRHQPVLLIWDRTHRSITVVKYDQPDGERRYVNDRWEDGADPYEGPSMIWYRAEREVGPQGAIPIQWETRSPALTLPVEQSGEFRQRVLHLQGTAAMLDRICRELVGVGLADIDAVFAETK